MADIAIYIILAGAGMREKMRWRRSRQQKRAVFIDSPGKGARPNADATRRIE